jgi:hypothetical protein
MTASHPAASAEAQPQQPSANPGQGGRRHLGRVALLGLAAALAVPALAAATPLRDARWGQLHSAPRGRTAPLPAARGDHDAAWRRHLRLALPLSQAQCGKEWVGGPA